MKKFAKLLVVAGCAAMACAALAGCGGTTYSGEYKYENPYAAGSYYGVKVEVVVDGDAIKEVKIVDSDYTQLSAANPDHGWTDENRANYTNNEAKLLKSFEGKKVADVKKYTVTCATNGVPESVTATGLDVITGATQSCGRLVLAVQDALKDVK